jgi:hypothetical protein
VRHKVLTRLAIDGPRDASETATSHRKLGHLVRRKLAGLGGISSLMTASCGSCTSGLGDEQLFVRPNSMKGEIWYGQLQAASMLACQRPGMAVPPIPRMPTSYQRAGLALRLSIAGSRESQGAAVASVADRCQISSGGNVRKLENPGRVRGQPFSDGCSSKPSASERH